MAELEEGDKLEKRLDEFRVMLRLIGGKERIYLVGEAQKSDGDNCLLHLFNDDIFSRTLSCQQNADMQLKSGTHANSRQKGNEPYEFGNSLISQDGDVYRTMRATSNASEVTRHIDSAMIIFIFSHEFVSNTCNHVCLKMIAKDIRARTEHNPVHPAVVGLVHSSDETSGILESVKVLDLILRKVFKRQPSGSIWAGTFIPDGDESISAFKKHACKVIQSSLSSGNTGQTNNHLLSLTCLSWWRQRMQFKGPLAAAEGIPLKRRLASGGHQGDFMNGTSSSVI